MRRVPRSKRGEERVTKILDAASTLFAQVGYEATTTNQIAAHAQTSIGSLYQFFPNKEAILEELAHRYNDALRAELDERLAGGDSAHFPDLLDRLIDTLYAFYMRHPGTHPVFFGAYKSESMEAASGELYAEITARFDALLAEYAPHLDEATRQLKGGLVASVIKSQLSALADLGDAGNAWTAELKRMIRAYVNTV